MTEQKTAPKGNAAAGCLGLVVIAVSLLVVSYYALGFNNRRQAAPPPAPAAAHSNLLDMDIPGAQSGLNSEAVAAAQDVARNLDVPCTTTQESFLLTDDITALDAVNIKMQAAGYDRVNLLAQGEATSFKTTQPKALFGIVAAAGLFLCEY